MKMMRIIQCGRQTVRVIEPDGQVKQLHLPATVADLLRFHPHHCVTRATNKSAAGGGGGGGGILPPEAHLESGGIYVLSPLPRLFPSSAAPPGPCSCFLLAARLPAEEEDKTVFVKCGSSIWTGKRQWGFSKISPEGVSLRDAAAGGGGGGGGGGGCGGGKGEAPLVLKRSRLWEPSLEIIMEEDMFGREETPSLLAANGVKRMLRKTKEWRQS